MSRFVAVTNAKNGVVFPINLDKVASMYPDEIQVDGTSSKVTCVDLTGPIGGREILRWYVKESWRDILLQKPLTPTGERP